MRTTIILIGLALFGLYLVTGAGSNKNPLKRIEGAEPFVWQKGCSKEDVQKAAQGGKNWEQSSEIPCECADPENEIKDWYERGLEAFDLEGYPFSYYRIGNDAVGIEKRNLLGEIKFVFTKPEVLLVQGISVYFQEQEPDKC